MTTQEQIIGHYPIMTSNTIFGILRDVARLREQRRIVKHLDRFFNRTGYSRGGETYRYRIDNLSSGIPEGDFLLSVQTRMTLKDNLVNIFCPCYFSSPNYQLDRTHKIDKLYKSCRKDGFIEPIYDPDPEKKWHGNPIETGIAVSKLGSDLIHPVGFIEIAFNKYPTPKLIAYTIIGTLFSGGVVTLIIKAIIDSITNKPPT